MPSVWSYSTRTFSDGPNTAIQATRADWSRTMAIGNSWSVLRLGVLAAIVPAGSFGPGGTEQFTLGLNSGTAHGIGSALTTNFVGAIASNQNFFFYDPLSGDPVYRDYDGSISAFTKKNTSTNAVVNGTPIGLWLPTTTGAHQRRGLLVLEIAKGSPNFSITAFVGSSYSAGTDFKSADLQLAVNQVGAPNVGGQSFSSSGVMHIPCSESDGILDTVTFNINFPTTLMEVYEVAVQLVS